MSLITKYRPRAFDEVVGQDKVVASIQASLAKKSSQAFLIAGAPGMGKTTLARLIAQHAKAAKDDILELDGTATSGVEDMRNLAREINYRPAFGPTRVVIIDEAQGISKAGMSALLKAVEEPPKYLYWIVCTTEPSKVPAALKQRCVALTLRPVKPDALLDLLESVVSREGLKLGKISTDLLDLCVQEAYGSPRQALSNLAVVQHCKDMDDAADLLQSAISSSSAIDLARLLLKGGNGKSSSMALRGILRTMKDQNAESVRHVIRAYMTNVYLGAKDERTAQDAYVVLAAFNTPFIPQDGIAPIIVTSQRLLNA